MATPLGHGLAGYAIGLALSRDESRFLPVAGAVVAIAPDLDFLPGLLLGQPALYHQGITHSVVVGALLAATIALVRLARWPPRTVFSLLLAAWASHLALDLLGPDRRPPFGIPLLWPLSDQPFLSPVTLLPGMRHAGHTGASTGEWLSGIFNLYNLFALAVEIAVITPLVLLARRWSGSDRSDRGEFPG